MKREEKSRDCLVASCDGTPDTPYMNVFDDNIREMR